MVIGNLLNKLSNRVNVNTEGGSLLVEVGEDYKIHMIGDAIHIASGNLLI